jgi:hypothetical protein
VFTYTDFQTKFDIQPVEERAKYKVLDKFMNDSALFQALNVMHEVLLWPRLLVKRFTRRTTLEEAQNLTCAKVLADLGSDAERAVWTKAFTGFKTAWNLCFSRVETYGCTPIPQDYRQMKMQADVAIVFCMPFHYDEGICTVALVNWLATEHNNFVNNVNDKTDAFLAPFASLDRKRSSDNNNNNNNNTNNNNSNNDKKKSSTPEVVRFDRFTRVSALQCSSTEFQAFIAASFGETGVLDFSVAETFLVQQYFKFKPFIEVGVPIFKSGPTHMSFPHESDGITVRPLTDKIPQLQLPDSVLKEIFAELDEKSKMQPVLRTLKVVIASLAASGGARSKLNDMGELNLQKYTQEWLRYGNDCPDLFTFVAQKVSLKYLDDLHRELDERMGGVTKLFDQVLPNFKQPLDAKLSEALSQCVVKYPRQMHAISDFLGRWKSHIRLYFSEQGDATCSLADTVAYMYEATDETAPSFLLDCFNTLQLSVAQSVAVFTCLTDAIAARA